MLDSDGLSDVKAAVWTSVYSFGTRFSNTGTSQSLRIRMSTASVGYEALCKGRWDALQTCAALLKDAVGCPSFHVALTISSIAILSMSEPSIALFKFVTYPPAQPLALGRVDVDNT